MKKNILLISYHAPPIINVEAILVWKTVRQLAESSNISIITAKLENGLKLDEKMQLPDNIEIIRNRTWRPQNTWFRRAAEKLFCYLVDEQFL